MHPATPASGKPAPRFLALWEIRFPVGAIASIGHRLSGLALLAALPALALALDRSLQGPAGYDGLMADLHSPWMAPVVFVLAWAGAHHLLAGIRHLLMDAGLGWRLPVARRSAQAALVAAPLAALALTAGWFA